MKLLLVVALLDLMFIPLVFVCHKVYQDGICGRIGLLGLAAVAFFMLLEMCFGRWARYDLMLYELPELVWIIVFFAVFVTWHLFRFHRRVLLEREKQEMTPFEPERRRVHHELSA